MSNYVSHSFLDIPDVNEPASNFLDTKSVPTPVYKPYYNTYEKTAKDVDISLSKERNSTIVKAYEGKHIIDSCVTKTSGKNKGSSKSVVSRSSSRRRSSKRSI